MPLDEDIIRELNSDIKYKLALLHVPFPLMPIHRPQTSTYVPTFFNAFSLIDAMDTCIGWNSYFTNSNPMWHPFISRMYFAFLMFYQILRAMDHCKLGSTKSKQAFKLLSECFPPESLNIPGPLLPVFQSICASKSPKYVRYGCVGPLLPEIMGPATCRDIIPPTSSCYGLPNFPLLAGFANRIINADPDNIPNYGDPDLIMDNSHFTVNGYDITANWGQDQRTAFLQPGMVYPPQTSSDTIYNFNRHGAELHLPSYGPDDHATHITDFLKLEDTRWMDYVSPMMADYSTFFKESETLGDCSPFGLSTSLVCSEAKLLTSVGTADNLILCLERAFPGKYPFELAYKTRSVEMEIPLLDQAIARYSGTNLQFDHENLDIWNINTTNHGREGPYWSIQSYNLYSDVEISLDHARQLIPTYYFIEKP